MRCGICEREFEPADHGVAMPFCSVRCKMIDRGRWEGEAYGLPFVDLDKPEDDPADIDYDAE